MTRSTEAPGKRLIDFHTHPWLPEHLASGTRDFIHRISPSVRQYGDKLSDPSFAADVLREQGVERAVVLAEHCPETSGNVRTETVLQFCAAEPDFYLPFASVNPNLDPDPGALVRRYVEDGAVGLKMYPSYQFFYPDERRVYPIYEACVDKNIPLLMHIGSSVIPGTRMKYCDPLHLDDLAVDFPDLVFIMAHGGRGFWYDACAFLAAHHPNFYIDITGLVPAKLLEYFPEMERNARKFIFGSDWYAMPKSPRENADVIARLGLSEAAQQLIFYGNAARILGLARDE